MTDSYGTALGGAGAVKVTYMDVKPPLLDLNEAIKQKSFFPKTVDDKVVGNPDRKLVLVFFVSYPNCFMQR